MKNICVLSLVLLTACNNVYVKPNTMAPKANVYAESGGYGMGRSIKEALDKRGYNVNVGKLRAIRKYNGRHVLISSTSREVPNNINYVISVDERSETFNPFWCPFNGFWWWNFNVSIADQKTGEEILSWRGRGCANSSVRKLNALLDELEKK